MKIRVFEHPRSTLKTVLIYSGILYEIEWNSDDDINYKIQYSVDAAYCNFHLNKIDRETIKAVKLWQEATNKLSGRKCF
jgi:hypothetical protein